VILGDPEPEAKVVSKYLRVAHPRYKQLIVSIETLLDISKLTVEEVIGWLTAATDDEPAPAHIISKLNLMEEELSARVVSRLQLGVDTSASGSGQRRVVAMAEERAATEVDHPRMTPTTAASTGARRATGPGFFLFLTLFNNNLKITRANFYLHAVTLLFALLVVARQEHSAATATKLPRWSLARAAGIMVPAWRRWARLDAPLHVARQSLSC
jgi:hypothetical protein